MVATSALAFGGHWATKLVIIDLWVALARSARTRALTGLYAREGGIQCRARCKPVSARVSYYRVSRWTGARADCHKHGEASCSQQGLCRVIIIVIIVIAGHPCHHSHPSDHSDK